MKLRLHVHHAFTGGWCADIDDDQDRQPDDPYWCVDQWPTLEDAITAGCHQLAKLSATLQTTHRLPRTSDRHDGLEVSRPMELAL
jgi:hypothetical protein